MVSLLHLNPYKATAMADYKNMSHADLYALRSTLPSNDPRQAEIGPYEHRAFAREWTQDSPWIAPLSLAFAVPAYTAAKATGLQKARTPASWGEIGQGYAGIYDGLKALMTGRSQQPQYLAKE